ncbi:hypothetical protein B5G00_11815 [Blautia sp. An46]|nr:hypothetical protein B5G00_11815 [Blautia sp. An46]
MLFRRCLLGGFLQVFQQLDCLDIGLELSLGAAFAQVIVSDTEILGGATQIGLILLVIAFLISPYGLPMAAIWLLGKVQDLKFIIQDLVYG